jgi:hypothetical protein
MNTWINEVTGKPERFDGLPPADRLHEFLPQIPAAKLMFQALLGMGHDEYYAWGKVMDSCTPGTAPILPILIENGLCS